MAVPCADFALLKFNTYQDYLESFCSVRDKRYVENVRRMCDLVKLGYSRAGRVYEEDEFKKSKELTMELINPKTKLSITFDHLVTDNDPVLLALEERMKPNLLKKLSTIIFIVARQPNGFDISSYKDYAHSLRQFDINARGAINWRGVFMGTHKLRPTSNDLSYYDAYKKLIIHNDSDNYKTRAFGQTLYFHHKGDHKVIVPELKPPFQTNITKRSMYLSPKMGRVILYDHVVRKPL